MKKTVIIVIIAMLILSACGNNNQPDITPIPQTATPAITPIVTTEPTATPYDTATPDVTETPTSEPTVQPLEILDNSVFTLPQTVVDNNDLSAAIEDVIDANGHTVEIVFNIANNTGTDFAFTIDAISVNNIVMPFYADSTSVEKGTDGIYTFSYSKNTMLEYGIEEILDIQLYYSVLFVSQSIATYQGSYHLQGAESSDYTIDSQNTLVASNEYINVYWVSAQKDSYQDEYYQLIVENKNDITLNLNMTAIAINSISVPSSLNLIMLPNSVIMHRGYVSGAETSFLTDVGKVQKVEVEFMGHDRLSGANQFTLASDYVFEDSDENTNGAQSLYDGQIIYNNDDMTIGIKKVYDENNACNQFEIYIKNNKEDTAYLSITDVLLDDGPVGNDYNVAVLANTYATQIITLDDYITDGQYEMSITYDIRYSYTATAQTVGLSFVLQ